MWGNVTFKEKEIAYWKMVEQGFANKYNKKDINYFPFLNA
jgi:hypothetical protein